MADSDPSLPALARELFAASTVEPGRADAGVGDIVERSSLSASDAAELIAAVRESQLLNARLRRRTAELEALVSTASELVRLQDVDDVLRRLVERAHELMGTDVTYLSEVENDAGDLRVRHSAGTVTADFRDLLVPSGYGLASKIAESREPAWVARYQQMSGTPHDARIDAAVEAEGLVSFLGVPLAVGNEVLGALFACNRFGYEYKPEEVLLLSAFADHAAAVLHTVRAFAERAAATARAEQAYRELEDHLAATKLAGEIHEELTSAVISGGTVADLVATVAQRLNRRVSALDEDGRPLQESNGGLPPRRILLDAIVRSQASGHAESFGAEGRRWALVAMLGADRVLGAIIAEESDAPVDDVDRRTLERAAHVAALVSYKREAAAALRAERRARWLLAILDGVEPEATSAGQQSMLSAPVSGCAILDVRHGDAEMAAKLAAAAVADDGIVAHRGRSVIIAWSVRDAVEATERVRTLLASRLQEPALTAVVCRHVESISGLGAAVEKAAADLRFLSPLGIEGTTVSSDILAPYHALSSAEPEAVTRFVGGLLGGVLAWDARRGAALFDTLACYFDSGESSQVVAEKMHIHKNTVLQRMQRVHVLLDGEWGDSEFRFRVQAAVRLERLRRQVMGADAATTS